MCDGYHIIQVSFGFYVGYTFFYKSPEAGDKKVQQPTCTIGYLLESASSLDPLLNAFQIHECIFKRVVFARQNHRSLTGKQVLSISE